jgi:hypothetical protein
MDEQGAKQPMSAMRPKFLTILCYLTLFGSIYMSFSAISGLASPEGLTSSTSLAMDNWETAFEQMAQKDPSMRSSMDRILSDVANANTPSNMRDYSFFNLVYNLLTLIGAALMLKLKKNGFRLYVLGILISVITPLLVFGTGNLLGQAFSFYFAISGGLFLLLYRLKTKYME